MLELTSDLREQVLEICQSLVRVKSHSGDEGQVADLTVGWMDQLGYEDVRVDKCGNVTGKLASDKPGPVVLYDSHLDTVPTADAEQWSHDPFSGAINEGKLYGRGSSDMKGPLAACMVGLAAAKRDGTLRGTAFVTASVGEEHIEGLALGPVMRFYAPDLVVICEPTGLRLATAQRGRAEIEIVVHGRAAHASSPEIGINAFRHMSQLAVALDEIAPPTDEQLGAGILEPTTVISTPYPNVSVIPFRCNARYDRRTLVGESPADVLKPIHEVIDQLAATNPDFRAEAHIVPGEFTCYTGHTLHQETFAPAWRMERDSVYVRAAQNALPDVELGHYSFCTNGSYTKGRAGIPTLGYGPGYEHVAHTKDEYIETDQLFRALQGYHALGGLQL